MSEKTIKNVITPNDLFIRDVFSRSKAFHIDIYQREYKWSKDQVEALLNDIELRFNIHNQTKSAPKEIQEKVLSTFEPYYLNTFLTHSEPLCDPSSEMRLPPSINDLLTGQVVVWERLEFI